MLAPEDEGRAIEALRFSLASDIVELVVLTADDPFLQTLREAVGPSRRLWHVPSAEKVSDLLVAGGVGILVLDVQLLGDTANRFIGEIKRQFPDLVVVAAGQRGAESGLARLISDGTVYRFIHKPMSPGRARLFADAAVKKYDEQRKRDDGGGALPSAVNSNRGLLIGGAAAAAVCLGVVVLVSVRHGAREDDDESRPVVASNAPSPLLANAARALAANQLTTPSGASALEYYLRALAQNPADPDARAGLAEVHERLLARAENALLEERLDEAAVAIETARKAGVESGRIAFLSTQLAKARELHQVPGGTSGRNKDGAVSASAGAPTVTGAPAGAPTIPGATTPTGTPPRSMTPAPATSAASEANSAEHLASLATERVIEGHLLEPEHDNAGYYVREALRVEPNSSAAQQAEQSLAVALMAAVRSAIDQRDFARAASLLDAASGIVAEPNIDMLRESLAAARLRPDTSAAAQLLKNAQERIQQDHLIEPDKDSAKYYLITLRGVDANNAALGALTQDLGGRLMVKARRALALNQYDAARSWLDAAASIGYSSADVVAAQNELQSAQPHDIFQSAVINANELTALKSPPPEYPLKARGNATEGWVELEFTVAEDGGVKDIAVRAASPAGTFERAASSALAQWRYQPVTKDGRPVQQRARVRIRFTLAPLNPTRP